MRQPGAVFAEWGGFADELADAAADAILPYFRTPMAVEHKPGKGAFDPVTLADREAEAAMRALIMARFPDHGVIGEEFPPRNRDAEHVWILDPIDGTKAFITGFPLWGTLIALVRAGRPVLGLVNQPYTKERYGGADGMALLREAGTSRPLRTRACAGLDRAVLTTTSPLLIEAAADLERFQALEARVRLSRYGGDCYGYCMLAGGHTDIIVETGLKAHDIAALIPIIEGAGGIVTDWCGGSALNGGRIVACGDPALHPRVLDVLNGKG